MKSLFVGISTIITTLSLAVLRTPTASALAGGVRSGVEAARGVDMPTNILGDGGVFTMAVNFLLFLIGAIAVIMIIFGGFRYVVSGGDSSAVTSAKNTILYAIIGLVVALLAYAIIDFVLDTLMTGTGGSGL